jgi:hypothetical protein
MPKNTPPSAQPMMKIEVAIAAVLIDLAGHRSRRRPRRGADCVTAGLAGQVEELLVHRVEQPASAATAKTNH